MRICEICGFFFVFFQVKRKYVKSSENVGISSVTMSIARKQAEVVAVLVT